MKPEEYKIRTALISVSDKTGIAEFAKSLQDMGIELFSTGGTAKLLKSEGLKVNSVSDITKFPEILDGRVKTLHPAVHAGLLARLDNENHINQMKEHELSSIDLLVVNLYPFEETLKKGSNHEQLIENIDIGGPTMLRAAAKNYLWTAPITDPEDYNLILTKLSEGNGSLDTSIREELAYKVFAHTAYYDSLIADYLRSYTKKGDPDILVLPARKELELRYGENPHQPAALYGNFGDIFKKLHGKDLSYNNILDIDAAANLIYEFDKTACCIIKHTNPCGAATDENLTKAFDKAFATDSVSPFGGIIVANCTVNKEFAERVHGIFTEVIIAPEFTNDALEILMQKKARRLIVMDFEKFAKSRSQTYKSVAGGLLMQHADTKLYEQESLKIVSKRKPTEEEMQAMLFGWRIVKHVKSNAVIYTAADRTLAIGAGQMSRVDSSRIAVEKAKLMNINLSGSAVASDAFFPFADGVIAAVEAGATCVIQPGGSVRDEEVIKAADDNNIAMIMTGMRHFRH
jgi:phosphoribosylaminoimidazolecarboxamide formyltransferase / IMP cyclohydrolase